ncbi:mitochondrial carrier [Apiospora arundinis]
MSSTSTRTNLHDILPALHHALSGATGTAIATCTTYPLSLVLTRLQAQRQLAREGVLPADEKYEGIIEAFSRICAGAGDKEDGEGWKALYTGLTQDVTKSVLDSFLFFLFYELFQSRLRGLRNSRGNSKGLGVLGELAVGVAAGAYRRPHGGQDSEAAAAANLSVREIAAAIRREKGLAGLWSGYSASLILTLNPSLTFFLQEFLKRALLSSDRWDEPGARLTFLLAAVSKAMASAVTYPFQIAKSRLQPEEEEEEDGPRDVEKEVEAKLSAVRAGVKQMARRSIFGTLVTIAREEGVTALYDGLSGELLKGFFSHGTTMLAKDVVHKLLFKLYLFLAGALGELRLRKARAKASLQRMIEPARRKRSSYDDDGAAELELPRALTFRKDFSEISRSVYQSQESGGGGSSTRPWMWFLSGGGGSKSPESVPDGDAAGFIVNMTDRSQRKIC